MKAGKIKPGEKLIAAVLILLMVTIIGSVWWISGGSAVFQSIGGAPQGGGQIVSTGASCVGVATTVPISFSAQTVDPTLKNQKTQVATNMYVYDAVTDSALLSTTGTTTNVTTFYANCDPTAKVNEIAGDDGTTYYNAMLSVGTGATSTSQLFPMPSGAGAILFNNLTNPGWASTINLGNISLQAGTDSQSIGMLISGPSAAGTLFGDKAYAVCFSSNAANWSRVGITNSVNQTPMVIPHVTSTLVSPQNQVQCYEMAGLLTQGATRTEHVILQHSGNILANTTITVKLVDKTGIRFNGGLVDGYDTVSSTGATGDVGRADVSTTNAITLYAS